MFILSINEAVNVMLSPIHIPSQVSKNRKGRDVPITREVAKFLQELHREVFSNFDECEHVIYKWVWGSISWSF
ncbi:MULTISPECIES: hypothetical protein [Bacillus]|uniref:Uncharacterized protein n=2 Tax=Bacillus TaxID=1386 RepID=A0A0M4FH07_9BACI|nr:MULTISPECIES: hypothetical protein [Bacillus]ALC81924.1 hypothetical protein AM592_10135 [Bacillus gobiensis]MBP1083247.1 CRISPR/Cas system endoribonuclease Cas6 (RAMP superfamily) [Bacillus capparidis]MED1097684.1 hypothetical protein [Bacillus capparidis]